MEHNKTNNQHYGNLFECCLCDIVNNNEYESNTYISERNISISEEEKQSIYDDAKDALTQLNLKATKAQRIGNHTKNENGDVVLDDKMYELKYVSAGTGTYLNTSINYFDTIGAPDFKQYVHSYICPILEKQYGDTVYQNTSPVSLEESKNIRHNKTDLYEEVKKADKEARKTYVNDLYNYFINNPKKLYQFYVDIATKNISNKSIADNIIVYNYDTHDVKMIDTTDLNIGNVLSFKKTNLGFIINNFRIQIGWQNGSGLNNPTIRAFIK